MLGFTKILNFKCHRKLISLVIYRLLFTSFLLEFFQAIMKIGKIF